MTCPPLTSRVLLKLNASKVQLPPTRKPEMEVQVEIFFQATRSFGVLPKDLNSELLR